MRYLSLLLVPFLIFSLTLAARAFSMEEFASFFAFTPTFTGGVNVALCGPDTDGRLYLVAGSGPGEQSRIRVYRIRDARPFLNSPIEFLAYDRDFAGGVSVGCAVQGAVVWVTSGAGPGGGPHVRVWRVQFDAGGVP